MDYLLHRIHMNHILIESNSLEQGVLQRTNSSCQREMSQLCTILHAESALQTVKLKLHEFFDDLI